MTTELLPFAGSWTEQNFPLMTPFGLHILPPNHFNCRSTVRAIFKGSEEAKRVRKKKPKDIPPVPKGFAASPLDSWWKLTDSMAKRIVKYGQKDEVL